ncbi:glycosyltransferase family 9 protein, partial [Streptomyces sp. NPDC002553]|uniref:glycosyltransferase family 9 protein n=1 Tax=Streptomyces sp. NPDC002553 TaxID=3154417 RepID=UPI003324D685
MRPGTECVSRRRPAERYAALIRRLRATGRRVVVTRGPGEDALMRGVAGPARAAGAGRVVRRGLPFGELSALIAGGALLVSGDTGLAARRRRPRHVAVAHGTPPVTLFGPVAPRLWGAAARVRAA